MQGLSFRKKHKTEIHLAKDRKYKKKQVFGRNSRRIRRNARFAWVKRLKSVLAYILQLALVITLTASCIYFFGLRISNAGEAMAPALKNGSVVLVDRIRYGAIAPKRGDVIVYNSKEGGKYEIRRVVGVPGETVNIKDGVVYIDGEKQSKHIFVDNIENPGIAEKNITLKAGEYFVLGDNSAASEDSRTDTIGVISKKDIVGKAWFVTSKEKKFGLIKN